MKYEYNPLVSVIIPVYKGYPYLYEAINSVLAQTYNNIEVIVVNDGSPDNGETEKIAFSYGDKIRYFSKPNGGVSTALNYGIKQMRGEWFSWLSHDDLFERTKIEQQIRAVQEIDDKKCVIRCGTSKIDKNGNNIIGRHSMPLSGCYSGSEMLALHLLKKVSLYGCSLLIHKDIIEECGLFDESLRMVQDEDYWMRIMFHQFSFVSISKELVRIRIHEGQVTNVLSERFAPELKVLANRVLEYYDQNPSENLEKLITFTCKQAMEGRKDLKKYMISEILKRSQISINQYIKVFAYTGYGFFYSKAKKVYKTLFIKKHHKE